MSDPNNNNDDDDDVGDNKSNNNNDRDNESSSDSDSDSSESSNNNDNDDGTNEGDVDDIEFFPYRGQTLTGLLFPREITHMRIDSSLTKIEPNHFEDCIQLVQVKLSLGITKIGENAFQGCVGLKRIHVPNTVTEIGDNAFSQCEQLRHLKLFSTSSNGDDSNRLLTIGKAAFLSCSSLVKLEFPSSLIEIGDYAFRSNTGLRFVYFAEEEKEEEGKGRILKIGKYAFARLRNIFVLPPEETTEMNIPKTVFRNCFDLRKAAISRNGDVANAIQQRLQGLPIHQCCYFQQQQDLLALMDNDNDKTSILTIADSFGMTPIHFLALSVRVKSSMAILQSILHQQSSVPSLQSIAVFRNITDCWGWTPLDYSCYNVATADSSELFKALVQCTFGPRLEWLGVDQWKRAVQNEIDRPLPTTTTTVINGGGGGGVEVARKMYLIAIQKKLAKYERMEAIALLELVLWKVQMQRLLQQQQQQQKTLSETKDGDVQDDTIASLSTKDRNYCRTICDSNTVIGNVLKFLDGVPTRATSAAAR